MAALEQVVTRGVETLIRRSLRRTFRRVCWVGAVPQLPPHMPVILYANHHSFHDGYLLWLIVTQWLKRPGLLWMRDWDRFPLFAPLGVLPLPDDDPARRAATLRRTIRRLHQQPNTMLVLFPGRRLHPPEEGIEEFSTEALTRLDRLLPPHVWWPVALHLTWWGEAQPTALATGGTPHPTITGAEHAQLNALWQDLRSRVPEAPLPLLEGGASPQDRWDLSFAQRFFARWL